MDVLRQYSAVLAQARTNRLKRKLWQDLLRTLVRDVIPQRPGRTEPRAVKRRPKPYPLLNRPRRKFVELPHRSKRWKAAPANIAALTNRHLGQALPNYPLNSPLFPHKTQ